ncbi:hypothetical protein RFI_01571, partial [Reticulomyxa filosa]
PQLIHDHIPFSYCVLIDASSKIIHYWFAFFYIYHCIFQKYSIAATTFKKKFYHELIQKQSCSIIQNIQHLKYLIIYFDIRIQFSLIMLFKSLQNIEYNYLNFLKQQSKIKHILQCLHSIKSNKFNNQTFQTKKYFHFLFHKTEYYPQIRIEPLHEP